MGEIAEMMTEGTLCVECGVALECEGFGIPIMCHDCHEEYQELCRTPHLGKENGGIICERFYR